MSLAASRVISEPWAARFWCASPRKEAVSLAFHVPVPDVSIEAQSASSLDAVVYNYQKVGIPASWEGKWAAWGLLGVVHGCHACAHCTAALQCSVEANPQSWNHILQQLYLHDGCQICAAVCDKGCCAFAEDRIPIPAADCTSGHILLLLVRPIPAARGRWGYCPPLAKINNTVNLDINVIVILVTFNS